MIFFKEKPSKVPEVIRNTLACVVIDGEAMEGWCHLMTGYHPQLRKRYEFIGPLLKVGERV